MNDHRELFVTNAHEGDAQLQQATNELAPLLLTVEEAAARLGLGRTFTFALIGSGELESVAVGRLRRVPVECLTEYVNRLRSAAHQHQTAA
ncbi:excisionase family DNA-binding protein [Kribbella italica]|uniref:Excisionase family DNA binding protein n=1 Tax=Kribbella italica TaxID=1540520 RepID=A0A7W9JDD4_9ACTN|nr:excisionase family DNA-binding protein [Kribbella italica]MBB5839712.1 excisionase family DNA binding protein [Kribbella italica]